MKIMTLLLGYYKVLDRNMTPAVGRLSAEQNGARLGNALWPSSLACVSSDSH
jgi:hypothetical protein